ncbi:MAG: hypothetical protein KDN18_16540 [Verrucomicrobiae bacterium]|nr:hypothetical protein [Verrucomicrobiae bacterium]
MKITIALLAGLGPFLTVLQAEEPSPIFSVTLRWTTSGGEAVETKVPGLDLLDRSSVSLPITRDKFEPGDPTWHAQLEFRIKDGSLGVEIYDHSQLQSTKESGMRPVMIYSGTHHLVWGKELIVIEMPRGKLSVVPEVKGPLPEVTRNQEGPIPPDLAGKIQFSYKITAPGNLSLEVYNPTEYSIDHALIRVTAPAAEGREALDRVYRMNHVSWSSFSDGGARISIPTLAEYPEGTPIQVKLEKVF